MTQKNEEKTENTIFVQIASYRDPQLLPTLKDMLDKSDYPENLRIGICWQHSDQDVLDNLDEFKDDPRFRIIDINYAESKGVCWARNSIQQLYQDEKYTLQLDSHHRFVKGLDTELINMVLYLQSKGHPKPLLTALYTKF